jgi:hypothetical protein
VAQTHTARLISKELCLTCEEAEDWVEKVTESHKSCAAPHIHTLDCSTQDKVGEQDLIHHAFRIGFCKKTFFSFLFFLSTASTLRCAAAIRGG